MPSCGRMIQRFWPILMSLSSRYYVSVLQARTEIEGQERPAMVAELISALAPAEAWVVLQQAELPLRAGASDADAAPGPDEESEPGLGRHLNLHSTHPHIPAG